MTWAAVVTESVTDQPPTAVTVELSGGPTSAPGRIRTSDQQLRRLLLYPPELRARSDRRQHNTPPDYTTGRHKKNATARIA